MTTEQTGQPLPTRTTETEQLYHDILRRFQQLAQEDVYAGRADTGAPEAIRLAVHFRQHEDGWAAATARLYRAALVHGLQRHYPPGDAEEALALLYYQDESEEVRMVRKQAQREKRRRQKRLHPRCSQQKAKAFSQERLLRLLEELVKSHSKWARPSCEWLLAGVWTGLRPAEWGGATLMAVEGRPALLVKNAKATNGRAHGTHRTLLLDLDEEQLKVVARHLERVHGFVQDGSYATLYTGCRKLICAAADRVFPKRVKHPTLYTARHMFSAVAKSMFGKAEVAALMGHASIKTAGTHYARRCTASGESRVRPHAADVHAVDQRNPPHFPATSEPGLDATPARSSPLVRPSADSDA
ncbi:hypothetical protein E4K72_10495 [Oxalobacteraceae bacterium OM1]|nr:hypothetical protein E4K72_10495 [Oxalobacteraceae bacterium OM1]